MLSVNRAAPATPLFRQFRRRLAVLSTVLMLLAPCVSAQEVPPAIQARIARVEQGLSSRVVVKGATPASLFQAGSISKSISAMGALQLVEQAKLSLDGPADMTIEFQRMGEGRASGFSLKRGDSTYLASRQE